MNNIKENNILSKEEILEIIHKFKQPYSSILRFASERNGFVKNHPNKCKFKNTYNYINESYICAGFPEKLYKFIYGDKHCLTCNSVLKSNNFSGIHKGYTKFCSKTCAAKHSDTRNKINNTRKINLINDESCDSGILLTRDGIKDLIKLHHLRVISIILKSKKYRKTYNFINKTYTNTCSDQFIEKVYQYVHDLNSVPLCYCGHKINTFKGFKDGYFKHCSLKCSNNDVDVKIKKENVMLERYGVKDSFSNNIDGKKLCDKNIIERYGSFENYHKIQHELSKKSIENKYGTPYFSSLPEFNIKVRKTKLERYGNENYVNSKKIQESTLKRYITDPDWQYKNSTFKSYILPSGKEIKIQGYEHFALNLLFKKYTEDLIVFNKKEIPKFRYIVNEKCHFYIPDIYIPKENLIIEVKSKWTLEKHKEINELKKQSVLQNGYNFKYMVFDRKGELINE